MVVLSFSSANEKLSADGCAQPSEGPYLGCSSKTGMVSGVVRRVEVSLAVSLTLGQCDAAGPTVSFPAYADDHCAYPRRDGQAELMRVAGQGLRRTDAHPIHPSINRVRRRLTSLIETGAPNRPT